MTITVTYSHLVPTLRQRLCYEVHAAAQEQRKGRRTALFRGAYAYAEALDTVRRSEDAKSLWVAGIMERDALPVQAVELTAEYLGHTAAELLGLPGDDEEIVRGLRAREEAIDAALRPSPAESPDPGNSRRPG